MRSWALEWVKGARRTIGLLLCCEDGDSGERQWTDAKPNRLTHSGRCGRKCLAGIKIPQSLSILRTQNIKLALKKTGSKIKTTPNHSFVDHLHFQKPECFFNCCSLQYLKAWNWHKLLYTISPLNLLLRFHFGSQVSTVLGYVKWPMLSWLLWCF